MEVAKSSLKATIRNSPPDIPLALMSFADCNKIKFHGSFAPSQRQALLRQVDRVRAGRQHRAGKSDLLGAADDQRRQDR